jgi:hypothetical protein
LAETKSTPQEDARLEVTRIFLNETVRGRGEYVQGMKAELVFNLDEVGVSEWEDCRDKKVVIPRALSGQTIHHHASRNLKHTSVITCISAAGESPTPYIVIWQDSESFRRKLMIRGVRLGIDLVLRRRSRPYLDAICFFEYVNNILIPYLNE